METKNQPPQSSPPPPPTAVRDEGGINLLPEIAENEIKAGVYKRKVNVVALGILGAIGIVIVVIFLFQGGLALRANSIRNDSQEAEARIQENQTTEIKLLATKEKLDRIEELLTKAIPSSSFVAEVGKAASTAQPITITGLTISENGEALVDGVANSSETLKQWVANITSSSAQEFFGKINAASLTGNPSEGYKFAFKLSFLKKGVYTSSE